jgi:hypothetical protein
MSDDLTFREVQRQTYAGNNCVISTGFVDGDPVDTMYLQLEKDGQPPIKILMRPDEAASIAWCLTGVLWSNEMTRLDSQTDV